MIEELKQNGVDIVGVYFCPHYPEAAIEAYRVEYDCRKPKIGLYKQVIDDFKIDVAQSFAIGDKIRDCRICEESECKGYLIADNEKSKIIKKIKAGKFRNVEYAADLREAIEKIVSRTIT